MTDLTPNNDQFLQHPYPDDEIDLKELFMVLWAGKWLISAVTGLAAAISVVVALSLPNIYTASSLLAPAQSSSGGMSNLMKQYGGLASLAGVSLPDGEDRSRAQLGMQLLRSRAFIGKFVESRDILPELMATQGWEVDSGKLSFDPELYDADTKKWVRDADFPKRPEPSLLEAYEAFMEILAVSEDKRTGFVTVTIDHHSPIVAAQWVNWLVDDVNAAVRAQDVAEAEKSIEYLKQQVDSTPLADLQAMFFELIQSQIETVMLAEARPEYVFKSIDPAVIPEEKSKPNRILICVAGTLLGAVIGACLALFLPRGRYNGAN
ncbi:MAG: LPS O-antigen length regulator [Gammaproteobacteria bacterium]|nr:LPS O-antigen length regulator [Gammaproteobacteria bacterium]